MKIYRICGYGSGRSALVVKLVKEFDFRGIRIAVIKYAHKPFDMDKEGSDTWNLRQSGCQQTLIANNERWGLLCETPQATQPDPIVLARHLGSCDLVLAVGFDNAPLPGLETLRADNTNQPLYSRDKLLQTVVSNDAAIAGVAYRFPHDAVEALADHILAQAVPLSD
jgi:molybdopterin-guanine dinucleotide biosynthesis protein B